MEKDQSEQVAAIFKNKVFAYAYAKEYNYESLENLITVLEKASGTESFNKYELVVEMDRFARIYELFRPKRIAHEDHYFGTVAMMDNSYGTIYGLMRIQPLHRFSKVDGYSFHEPGGLFPEKMVWEKVKDDLNHVKDAVIRTINQKAVEAYVETGLLIPQVIKHYIRNFIKYYSPEIKDDQIEFISAGVVKINNWETEINDVYDFSVYLSGRQKNS